VNNAGRKIGREREMESKLWIKGRDGWYVAAWGTKKHIDWYAKHYEKTGYETSVGFEKPKVN
jgi:hypothetical protein